MEASYTPFQPDKYLSIQVIGTSIDRLVCRHFADKLFSNQWYGLILPGTKHPDLLNGTDLIATWKDQTACRASYF